MKRFSLAVKLIALSLGLSSAASAATLTVGQTTGHTFDGPGGINSAVAACVSGDVINVLDAGTYTSVTLLGNKSYTIQGTVPGVVVVGNAGAAWTPVANTFVQAANQAKAAFVTSPTAAGNMNVRIVGINAHAPSGALGNAPMLVFQHSTRLTSLTLVNSNFRHLDTGGTGGDGFRLQMGLTALGAGVNISATSCTFETNALRAAAKQGFGARQTAAGAGLFLQNANLNFDKCFIHSKGRVMQVEVGNGLKMNFNSTRIISDPEIGSRVDGLIMNNTSAGNAEITFNDCTIHAPANVVNGSGSASNGNKWVFNRCLLSTRRNPLDQGTAGTQSNNVIRLQYGASTVNPGNDVKLNNCVIIGHPLAGAVGTAQPGLVSIGGANMTCSIYHCTLWDDGTTTGGASGVGLLLNSGALTTGTEVVNTIFANLLNPLPTPVPAGKGYKNTRKNLVAGAMNGNPFIDDIDAGGDRTTSTIAALNLLHFIPQAGSTAINNASTSATILAAIGYGDKNKNARWLSNAPHDIGAYESATLGVPVELTGFAIE